MPPDSESQWRPSEAEGRLYQAIGLRPQAIGASRRRQRVAGFPYLPYGLWPMACGLFTFPHLQPDRRTFEAERVAQLVQDEALVREVELRRGVREQHEGRRRRVGLRRVHHAYFPTRPGRDGRVRLGDFLDEPIQLASADTLRTRLRNAIDRLEHLRRALAGQRRDVQHRGVVQEFQLPPQFLVERLHELRAAALHQVPLVRGNDDAGAGALGLARDG